MNQQLFPTLFGALVALSLASAASAQAGDSNIVIKAGKVITNAGETIENGTIVIQNGRITAVGQGIEYPWNAEVKEYPGSVAFPGFVEAHSSRGMDRANENIDVAAFLNVKDSIDPVSFYFEDALRAGVTTINVQQGDECVVGGMGYIVKPTGMTVEEMTVRPNSGLAMSATPKRGKSRATQAQSLREVFSGLQRYLEDTVGDKRQGLDHATREALYQGREADEETAKGRSMAGSTWKVDGLELIPRWEIDEKQAPLLKIVEGNQRMFVFCDSAQAVALALEVATDNGFLHRTSLVLEGTSWKAADMIAQRGVPVILSESLMYRERDPVSGEMIETFVPKVFQDKGVRFALRGGSTASKGLWYQAALCVGYGLTRDQALAATTTTSADLIGLGDRIGSLEVGKDGNVVIFSGDPLSVKSFVEFVVIEGELVYDRSNDTRVLHLDTGAQPENTAPHDPNADFKPHGKAEVPDDDGSDTDAGENEEENEEDEESDADDKHDDDKENEDK
jgi:imidazolonepropionase-like amidohydrolase